LTHPNKLSEAGKENLKKSWNAEHQGLSNAHRTAVLEEGLDIKAIGIPNDNAQFLESRKFQLGEIARLLHIPPHMLADLDRATFSNIEHQGIEFVTYTMTPWLVRWEQTCSRKLLFPFERDIFFFEFLVDALLRGDSTSRAAYYKELFYMGVMSPNDIREKENMNPIEDENADKYFVQQNMIPIELSGKQPAVKSPSPPASPDSESVDETVRAIAERDRTNILRAYNRETPDGFRVWLDDYSRDFTGYVRKQLLLIGREK
jgi:hypothetical protein